MTRFASLFALLVTLGCKEHTPSRSADASPPRPSTPVEPAPLGSANVGASLSSAAPSAEPAAPPAPLATAEPSVSEPPLFDASGKPLPQTEDEPKSDSPAFLGRIELLVEAIRKDQPELARPAFFPVVAYEQVKAIENPARDWEKRLIAAFDRTIHEYHRALGAEAEAATFAGIDVPVAKSRWMKPGSEGNRLGYYRVLRSTLRLRSAAGKERAFEITSMISWRGEWYVVHLNGFK